MKPIIRKIPKLTPVGERFIKTYRDQLECGKCHKKLTKYHNYCQYCGEKVEREV